MVIWRPPIVKVKNWVALLPWPFDAMKPIWKLPVWGEVPARVPVPLAFGVKVIPDGRLPNSETVGVGVPVVVTVKLPATLWVNVVALAEVMAGAWSTVRVKDWEAAGLTPLEALKVIGNDPVWVGVPDSEPWVNDTPPGSAPDSLIVGVGKPVAVGVKVPLEPTRKVAAAAEVMAGAWSTVRVKDWEAGLPTPLPAPSVIG